MKVPLPAESSAIPEAAKRNQARILALAAHVATYTLAFVPALIWLADDIGAWAIATAALTFVALAAGVMTFIGWMLLRPDDPAYAVECLRAAVVLITRRDERLALVEEHREAVGEHAIMLPAEAISWSEGKQASAVLDAFHSCVPIGMLEDFEFRVFHPGGHQIHEE